jgi:phosphatidylethanolamine/phosphatidyl-N-methylethanolamine N-methyltransferase
MSKLMREASTRKIYDVHSGFYDATFGRLVRRRIGRAIEHMNIGAGDRVLDLGIGTGASLEFYPADRGQIVGVDLSAGMLRECRKKIAARGGLGGRAVVFQADAMNLPFADDTFDHVFISHVITVVSDPFRLIRQAQRVAKPGAKIVIVNHFQSANRVIAMVEKVLNPICTKIGWRSDLALQDLLDRTGASVDYRFKLRHIDLWETVVLSNNKSTLSPTTPAPTVTEAPATVGWSVQARPAFG